MKVWLDIPKGRDAEDVRKRVESLVSSGVGIHTITSTQVEVGISKGDPEIVLPKLRRAGVQISQGL